MIEPKRIMRLSEIYDKYSCFFVDLWGVVHNGIKLFQDVRKKHCKFKKIKKNFFQLTLQEDPSLLKNKLEHFGIETQAL